MEIKFDLKNLDKYTTKMKDDIAKHYAKVGVLSSKAQRTGEGEFNNASLALVHELGSIDAGIPARPFFSLTQQKRGKQMAEFINANAESVFKQVMAGDTKIVLSKLGAKWVELIMECFETEGFGTWPPLSESTIEDRRRRTPKSKRKGGSFSPKMLQDTGELKKSITYEVE